MILVRVRNFMAREWERVRRFLSHKDPNRAPRLKQERRAYPPARDPRMPLVGIPK